MKTDLPDITREQAIRLQPITSLGELQAYGITDIAAAPQTVSNRSRRPWLPILVIALPVLLGAVYNFIIASDRYVSTASFVIRETRRGGILVGTGGMTRSDDDSFAIAEYVRSHEVVDELVSNQNLAKIFAEPGVDVFSRFPTALTGETREDLFRHFQHYVDFDFNVSTGISTLSVQAFTPAEANRLTSAILGKAEELVNQLNDRPRDDTVNFAENNVKETTLKLAAAQAKLTAYRNAERVINPDSEVAIANLLLTEMLKSLSETNAQISQLTASASANPKLAQLNLRREALLKNIAEQRQSMAGGVGSLALKIEGYETIKLERDLAEKSLTTAATALDLAKQESQRGRLYLERVVEPSVPDRYGYPTRYLNMLILIAICLSVYWIIHRSTAVFSDER